MSNRILISPAALTELIEAKNVVILDCRSSLLDKAEGERAYHAGHIPGAQYVHLEKQLSAPHIAGVTGRHPLPDRDAWLVTARSLGIKNDQPVVVYDQSTGAFAARCWWMLRWLGHSSVFILDGGFDRWQSELRLTDTLVPKISPSEFAAGNPLTRIIEAGDIPTFAGKLLDARDAARFRGETEPVDPVAGHIPGAQVHPFSTNLASGTFKSTEDLANQFNEEGITQDNDIACYCGSGVTACHNIAALLLAGFPEPALYPGSWSEWITDPERPIATDA